MSDRIERNCNKCIHHTSGMCDSWDCKIQTVEDVKKEAVNKYAKVVVEELETDSSIKLYGSQNSDNYMIPVNRAIEIVKQGCVGTETETIRDKAIKWNNNSSKRVPYEFIDYVEGKREIDVSVLRKEDKDCR